MFGLLMASASFIAAPAVLRHAIPQAKPSLYITSALGITFPFNIIVTLPILFTISTFVAAMMLLLIRPIRGNQADHGLLVTSSYDMAAIGDCHHNTDYLPDTDPWNTTGSQTSYTTFSVGHT